MFKLGTLALPLVLALALSGLAQALPPEGDAWRSLEAILLGDRVRFSGTGSLQATAGEGLTLREGSSTYSIAAADVSRGDTPYRVVLRPDGGLELFSINWGSRPLFLPDGVRSIPDYYCGVSDGAYVLHLENFDRERLIGASLVTFDLDYLGLEPQGQSQRYVTFLVTLEKNTSSEVAGPFGRAVAVPIYIGPESTEGLSKANNQILSETFYHYDDRNHSFEFGTHLDANVSLDFLSDYRDSDEAEKLWEKVEELTSGWISRSNLGGFVRPTLEGKQRDLAFQAAARYGSINSRTDQGAVFRDNDFTYFSELLADDPNDLSWWGRNGELHGKLDSALKMQRNHARAFPKQEPVILGVYPDEMSADLVALQLSTDSERVPILQLSKQSEGGEALRPDLDRMSQHLESGPFYLFMRFPDRVEIRYFTRASVEWLYDYFDVPHSCEWKLNPGLDPGE